MMKNILKRDFKRNNIITILLIIFIAISSMLSATAASLGRTLTKSMKSFFETAKTSHMIQMHKGDYDEGAIEKFASDYKYVKSYQIVSLLNIKGSSLMLTDETTEAGSVIENSFVVQNKDFDFILDQNNEIINLLPGEIGIPVYHALKHNLSIGDIIRFKIDDEIINFKIAAIARDSQMNSSFISSKRMLISEGDWEKLSNKIDDIEYLIEFILTDEKKVNKLELDYKNANLPANGPTITYESIKLLNSLNDIIMLIVVIVVSLLMIFISVLCIRFTMTSCMDEDYMEIGIMKGIGIPIEYIEKMYFIKYIVISLIGCIIGYLLSFYLEKILQSNLKSYMGLVEKDSINYSFQFIACAISGIIVLYFCSKVMKQIGKVSAIEALSGTNTEGSDHLVPKPSIYTGNHSTNVTLALKYILAYKKPYILMTLIFVLLIFLIILPLNISQTIESPNFCSYMGIPKCDIRIDLQDVKNLSNDISNIENVLHKDKEIDNYALYTTYSATAKNMDGDDVYLNFETGDFEAFKVNYIIGNEPKKENELGLSYLALKQLNKEIGDAVTIIIDDMSKEFIITGIYQDITNGGKSGKSTWTPSSKNTTFAVFNIDVIEGVNKTKKKEMYSELFKGIKVTDIEEYIRQSMADGITQLKLMTRVIIIVAIIIIAFLTIIFIKLLMIRDKEDLIIMRRIGFKNSDITTQYRIRTLIPLLISVVIGVILVNTLGQSIVGLFARSMGAPKFIFVTSKVYAYILCPLLVVITIIICVRYATKEISVLK